MGWHYLFNVTTHLALAMEHTQLVLEKEKLQYSYDYGSRAIDGCKTVTHKHGCTPQYADCEQ